MPTASATEHIETLECIGQCQDAFANLLERQSRLIKDAERSKVMTDRHVRDAFSFLLKGKTPKLRLLFLSHGIELFGGGLAAYGWHFAEDHPDLDAPAALMVLGGVALFGLGVGIREYFTK